MSDRYSVVRSDKEWLIIDNKTDPKRIVCTCAGWYADPYFVCGALNAYDHQLTKLLESANVKIGNM